MSISARLKQEFDSQVRARGNSYLRQGRVDVQDATPKLIRAQVDGDSGDYEVTLDLADAARGVMTAFCTCPYFEGSGCCKHIWATILQAEPQLAGAGFPKEGHLRIREEGIDLDDDPDEDEYEDDEYGDGPLVNSRPRGRSRPTFARVGGSNAKSQWRSLLDGSERAQSQFHPPSRDGVLAKPRQAWFVLDLAACQELGELVIELRQRELKQNGELGVFKKLSLNGDEATRWPEPELTEALSALQAFNDFDPYASGYWRSSRYGYSSRNSTVTLPPEAFNLVLPRLSTSQRFAWALEADNSDIDPASLVRWDAGPAWKFRLKIEADNKAKEWVVSGSVSQEEGRLVPVQNLALLLPDGLLLHEGTLARVEVGSHYSWMDALRREGTMRVPFVDRAELINRLWRKNSPPDKDLCDDLQPTEVRGVPRGLIRISRPRETYMQSKLYAAVRFSYDGREIPWTERSAAILDEAANSVLIRDAATEQKLLGELTPLGMQYLERNYGEPGVLEMAAGKLSSVVSALTAAGWTVEAEGKLIRRPGEYRLSVTSGVDWFNLEGEFDFGGVSAQLPELLAALRRGERFVKLGDGTQGILPEEWLAKFAHMASLGATEDGQVRFKPSQALLLDALLASQPAATFDKQFAAWRKKLQSFAGIKPREQPRGFIGTLRDYQRDGLGWLHFLREFQFGGCLADDMGLGKTIQVLSLLQSLKARRNQGERLPSLVVVPRSLVFNWQQEAAKFAPQLKVLDFAHKERGQQWDSLAEYDLIITTYGTLMRDIMKLKDVPFEYVILDEAQAIKNAHSQSAKACRLLTARHRLAMSGTPIENHLGELWSLFEFLNPGMLGQSEAFRRFSGGNPNGEDKSHLHALAKAISPFVLRRTKEQVLKELPEKTEQTIYCDLSAKERKQYNQLRDYYRLSLTSRIETEGLAKSKIHVLEALLRLRQAACHGGLLDEKRKAESSAKLDVLLEQLEEIVAEGHKVLVFSQFTKLLDIVRARLQLQGTVFEYLDGQTRDRQKRVDRFQSDPACPVFLVSLKAGGRGLNLTAADYVFILDPWWNPAVEAQAVDRVHRIGQTRHVFAYRLIARDTVEEKILELQATKRDLADAIISADSSLLQSLTAEDLRALLS